VYSLNCNSTAAGGGGERGREGKDKEGRGRGVVRPEIQILPSCSTELFDYKHKSLFSLLCFIIILTKKTFREVK
jgi:hypothetical protein